MLNDEDYISKHPFFYMDEYGNFYHKLKFDTDASIADDCFKCSINKTFLYLMTVFLQRCQFQEFRAVFCK